jgi:hypothetical protein
MIRNTIALLAGPVIAFVTIYLVELLGLTLYPAPANLDFSDSDAISAYITTLPLPALLFPLFAYFIGTFVGAYFAILVGQLKPIVFAGLVGLLVLTGTIANLIWIPHPLWFSIFAVIGIVASGWLALLLAPKSGHS